MAMRGNSRPVGAKAIDMAGTTVGTWRVLARAGRDDHGSTMWSCECTLCGASVKLPRDRIRPGVKPPLCMCQRVERPKAVRAKRLWKPVDRWVGKSHGVLLAVARVPEGYECRCLRCGSHMVRPARAVGGVFKNPPPVWCEHCRPAGQNRDRAWVADPPRIRNNLEGRTHGALSVTLRLPTREYVCHCLTCGAGSVRGAKSVAASLRGKAPRYCDHCRPVETYQRHDHRGSAHAGVS